MQLLKRVRKQKCVWWGNVVSTGTEKRTGLPVECKCRWDDKTTVIRLRKGGEYTSAAIVMIDRITQADEYLWLGSLDDLKKLYGTAIDDPRIIPDAKVIKKTETVGTLKAKNLTDMKKVAHWAYL